MQVIWSRAAQTRSCRCTSCLHHATTLARRTTTATGRRRLKTSDIFTACYSAIFATAAVLDAKAKDDRRKQWDQAIADVKVGLDKDKDYDFSTLQRVTSKDYKGHLAPHEVIENAAQSVFGANERRVNSSVPGCATQEVANWKVAARRRKPQLETHLRLIDAHLRDSPTTERFEHMDREDLPPSAQEVDSGNTSQTRFLLRQREPRTAEHFLQMEHMVAKLVTSLLLGTKRFALKNECLTVVPIRGSINYLSQEFNDIALRMISLQACTARLPAYSMSIEEFLKERSELNKSITAVISTKILDQGSVDLMVAKLCYNLLISTSPPNVHTYTTMIVHFTRLKQHHLAQAVIDSFFEHSRFAPNFWTVSAILDHYATIGDRLGFQSVIKRMRGVDGDMRIKRRHLSVMDEPSIQSLALKSKVIHRNGKLHWKMPRNELVFQSLVRGALQCFGVNRAVLYFEAAIREGWQLKSDLFIEIARVCLAQRNKNASAALISTLISRWQTCNELALEDDALARSFIYQLLHLCGIGDLTNVKGNILSFGFARLELSGWLFSIRFKDIKENITISAETLSKLDMILTTRLSMDKTPQQITSKMLSYLRWKSQTAYSSLFERRVIALAGSAARLADIEEELIATICGSLLPQSQKVYNTRPAQLPCSLGFPERLKVALSLRRARLATMPEAHSHTLATRSRMELLAQEPSVTIRSSPTSHGAAAIFREVPISVVDERPVPAKSKTKRAVRPESFPCPQFHIPSSQREAFPAGFVMLDYSDPDDTRNSHLRAATG